jgi:peptide-methionine (S)-S-oxide reductase
MKEDEEFLQLIMTEFQKELSIPIITSILPFGQFKSSEEKFHNYYFSDIEKPFCKTHISPKIQLLKEKYRKHVSTRVV